jgi:O-succinylbenzoic acid--CoA ligase
MADPASMPASLARAGGVIVHTSGSSGHPKAAVLTAEGLVAGAAGVAEAFGLERGDAWSLQLPLHHVAGIGVVVRCALSGAAIAFDGRASVTHVSMVDTQLHRVLQTEPAPWAGLRVVLLGGGPVAPALVDRAVAQGWPVAMSYGLTEMGSTVTATAVGAPQPERYSAGRPLPGREVRVVDGEIGVRGAGLFAGYLDNGSVHLPLDGDGFFRTGDLGTLDESGRLVVIGRADGRFVSGGENVQPEEVEAALASLPGVVRAVVVPVPDAEFGMRGVAFVDAEEGRPVDAIRLNAALAERLEHFKLPVRYLQWPAGPTGLKPSRRALTDLAAEVGGKPSP